MNKHFWKLYIPIAILTSVGIAIGLNFILQWQIVDCNIIGNNTEKGAPEVWLNFWVNYLAALASFAAVFVALYQNKKILNQNKEILDFSRAKEQYSGLETFVSKAEWVHSFNQLETIYYTFKQKSSEEALLELNNLELKLQIKSIQMIPYKNEKGNEILYEYGCCLAQLNKGMLDIVKELKEKINNTDNPNNKSIILMANSLFINVKNEKGQSINIDLLTWLKDCYYKIRNKEGIDCYSILLRKGQELLLQEYNKVLYKHQSIITL